MHPGMVHWVVLFCVLCRGLCTLTYAAEQTITRTVEEFTLGMPQDQALTLFIAGIKQHMLTLVETAQPQTDTQERMEFFQHHPMDAVAKQWVAPQSADVLYTINALLFDAPEFKDPVMNSTLAAQVAQSLSWSSRSCPSSLRVIPPPSKPGRMLPYHTTMRGRCHDRAPCLLPVGSCGTPLVMRHAALSLAKPRRGVTSATSRTGTASVQAQTLQRAQSLVASPTGPLRVMSSLDEPLHPRDLRAWSTHIPWV